MSYLSLAPRRALAASALGVALVWAAGCSSTPPMPLEPPPAPIGGPAVVSDSAHVAFAGGGWRAHTGHAAFVVALLDGGERTLDEAFGRVGVVASNSGGSWFSTMLAYSGPFVADIEAPDAINAWTEPGAEADGWLGRQQHLFDTAPGCHGLPSVLGLACEFEDDTDDHPLTWHAVVEDLVFSGYSVDTTLSGPRQRWADDKALLLAATLLTNEVDLGERDGHEQSYQACGPGTRPIDTSDGATCTGSPPPDVLPATFASVPPGAPHPAFLPTRAAGDTLFQVLWSGAEGPPVQAPLTRSHPTDGVPVMTAAAASSAAAGFVSSRRVTRSGLPSLLAFLGDDLSALGVDEALAFSLDGTPTYRPDAGGDPVADLARDRVVQIADGGAIDNSAVAHLVAYLQQTGPADGFHIVAFDHSTDLLPNTQGGARLGGALAMLFGEGLTVSDPVGGETCADGFCLRLPPLTVFDPAALATPATWRATAVGHDPPSVYREVVYTRYPVTTVANETFGVAAGTTGTLHAFTTAWTGAETAPLSGDRAFTAYDSLFRFVNFALHDDHGAGLRYLEAALGIR